MGRLVLFVFIILLIACFTSFSSAEEASDFTLEDSVGNSYVISDYLGTPIFLFYFECDADLSFFHEIYTKYSGHNIVFFAITNSINCDWFFSDIPLLIDQEGELVSKYNIEEISAIIIDSDFFVRYKSTQTIDELKIKSTLNEVLGVTGVEGVTWGRIKSLYIGE